ncbi:MAG: FkbM family methyltransferase, partial [Verrucomicrobiaceae bacterium]|nr:FkbM family methyltransferase [Verrucomicrobiaceae bacterium]
MLHFLKSYLQPGDHFLDIGANTGLHTLLASTCIDPSAGGRITCIEPDPSNVQRLRHALAVNHLDHVTVHPVAAAAHAGRVTLIGSDV